MSKNIIETEKNRTKERLVRAFRRVLRMHGASISPTSIVTAELDIKRIVNHAIRLGWLSAPPAQSEGEKQ